MLKVKNLQKAYIDQNTTVYAVNHIDFEVGKKKFFTLLGPSGCGKSTTLRCIAGLEDPTNGMIQIADKVVFDSSSRKITPSNQRDIGMVFQSYAIWPHMNVFENIAYPLRYSKKKYRSNEIKKKVLNVLDVVHLEGYENRPATKLSGGQQQRLALARALVSEPALLLLDEPLSNLDARLRQEMRVELKRLQNDIGITTVFVTHDQTEALILSDEIAVMKDGVIIQIGSPNDIYNHPRSEFVARFIGETNIFKGNVKRKINNDMYVVETDRGCFYASSQEPMYENEGVLISIRPENIVLSNERTSEAPFMNFITSKVEMVYFMGDIIHYTMRINDHFMKIQSHPRHKFSIGEDLFIQVRPEDCVLIRQ